jgi:hypothetical protein
MRKLIFSANGPFLLVDKTRTAGSLQSILRREILLMTGRFVKLPRSKSCVKTGVFDFW